jgi:hypothetical protein
MQACGANVFGALEGLHAVRMTADLVAAFFAPGQIGLPAVLRAYPEIEAAP